MSDARLPSGLFVAAHIRRCEALGLSAYLRHRGTGDSGGILLKICAPGNGACLLEMTMSPTGARAWMQISGKVPVDDMKAEETITRRLGNDPDLWVLEIEDPKGVHLLDEPVI